jgi:hypothetical protein
MSQNLRPTSAMSYRRALGLRLLVAMIQSASFSVCASDKKVSTSKASCSP